LSWKCTFHCHELMNTPLPKPEENQLPTESSCPCLKPKCLPVPTILLIQKNIIKTSVRNLGLLETVTADCLLPTHQWLANCLTAVSEVWPALHRIIIVILWMLWCHNILIPLSLLYQTLPNKSKPSPPIGAWHP
jgi:hypothetical protein